MNRQESHVNGTSACNAENNDLIRKLIELLVDQTNLRNILTAVLDKEGGILALRVLCETIRSGSYDRSAIAARLKVDPKVVTNRMSWARTNGVAPVSRDDQFARVTAELIAEGFALQSTPQAVSSIPSTPAAVYYPEVLSTPAEVSLDKTASDSTPHRVSSAAAQKTSTPEEVYSAPAEVYSNANKPATTTSLHSLKNTSNTEVFSILSSSEGSGACNSRARDGTATGVCPRQARLLEIAAPILKPTARQRGLQRFVEIETLATTGGLDFELDIVAGVSEVTRKAVNRIAAGQPPPSISTWRYFLDGIKDHAAARALRGREGALTEKRDRAPISPIPEADGAQKPPAAGVGAQACDLMAIPVLAGEIIDLDDARTLSQAELKSLAKNQELADKLRQSSPGMSQEAVQAVIDRLIGDAIKQRDIYRKPLPTAEAFVLRAKGECADIHLNANKAGTWQKVPGFDMTEREKEHAKQVARIDEWRRDSDARAKQEAEERRRDSEHKLEDYARKWLMPSELTRDEEKKLVDAIGAVRSKKARGEALTPHEEKLLKAERDKDAQREANRIFWEQRAKAVSGTAASAAAVATNFKSHIAARRRTEFT